MVWRMKRCLPDKRYSAAEEWKGSDCTGVWSEGDEDPSDDVAGEVCHNQRTPCHLVIKRTLYPTGQTLEIFKSVVFPNPYFYNIISSLHLHRF